MKLILMALLLLWSVPLFSYTDYDGNFSDFMGANQNVRIKDVTGYFVFASCFKWLRDYSEWSLLQYGSTDFTGLTTRWYFQGQFYNQLNANGINVLHCIMGGNTALGIDYDFPVDPSSAGTAESHYRYRAGMLGQLSARYGRKNNHPSASLLTTDKAQGLDYCRYYEDSNEPDQDWKSTLWPASRFAMYSSAAHDGRNCTSDSVRPIIGIKQGDPLAVHVMPGVVMGNTAYLDGIRNALGVARFNEICQVINYHTYCMRATWYSGGYSPENESYGLWKNTGPVIAWRNANAPGVPIWCTEFGWDTYISGSTMSAVAARGFYGPQTNQAIYLMRSFVLLQSWGIQKAFMFMQEDPGSGSGLYSTSGVLTFGGSQLKTSYFYLSQMQAVLGPHWYDSALSAGTDVGGGIQHFAYSYRNQNNTHRILVLWCRRANTDFDNGASLANRVYSIPFMTSATQIRPVDKTSSPSRLVLTVNNPGTASAYVTVLSVSEIPIFLALGGFFTAAVPTGVSAQTVDWERVRITWNAMPNVASYSLFRNSLNTSNGAVKVGGSVTAFFTNKGLQPSTTYYYFVRSYNGSSKSGLSTSAYATTESYTFPPESPSGFIALPISTNAVQLSWNALTHATSITLYRSLTGDFSTSLSLVGLSMPLETYLDLSLLSETEYFYWIRSANSSGSSVLVGPIRVKTGTVIPVEQEWKEVVAYPNPFDPTAGNLKFLGVPASTEINIYTVSGQPIARIVGETNHIPSVPLIWDGKNNSGEWVADGIYRFAYKKTKVKVATGLIVIKRNQD